MSEVDHLFPPFASLERKQLAVLPGTLQFPAIMVTMLTTFYRHSWALHLREILNLSLKRARSY